MLQNINNSEALRWLARRRRIKQELIYFLQALAIVCAVSTAMFALVWFSHWLETPSTRSIPVSGVWRIHVRFLADDTRTYNGGEWHSEAECELALHSAIIQDMLKEAKQISKEDYGGSGTDVFGYCGLDL